MPEAQKNIAFLANNAALSAILAQTLENEPALCVYRFETLDALTSFMRICPLDLAILDADSIAGGVTEALRGLRKSPGLASDDFEMVVLTRAGAAFHRPFHDSGANEVLSKPVMPQRLLRHVFARLGLNRPDHRRRRRLGADHVPARPDNVIQLFAGERQRKFR